MRRSSFWSRRTKACAAALATALAVAACSNDPDDSGGGGETAGPTSAPAETTAPGEDEQPTDDDMAETTDAAATTEPPAQPPVAVEGIQYNQPHREGTPQDGGSITIAIESGVTTLDPAGSLVTPGDGLIAHAIYDTLLTLAPDGTTMPGLATDVVGTDDLLTWTITLRDGVTFHDGTPFDADAVVASLERRAGSAEFPGAATLANVTSIEATDPLTVTVTLASPSVTFPGFLALYFVESPAAVAEFGDEYARNPVGTGPFRMADYDTLQVERNPDYWRTDDDGAALPYLDGIRFEPLPDATTRLQSIQSGTVDMIQTADVSNLVGARDGGDLDVQWISSSSSLIVAMNTSVPPFDDIRLRDAVALAIDRDQINEVVYEGVRRPAYSRLLPESPWHDASGDVPDLDTAAAAALVEELTADGAPVSFTLDCVPTPEFNAVIQLLEQQFEAVGMDVELRTEEQSAYVERIFSKSGDYEMACLRSSNAIDPDVFYNALYTDGATNLAFFSDPAVDAALDEARSTDDFETRKALYDTALATATAARTSIPILYNVFGFVHQPNISGLPAPVAGSQGVIDPATLYIES